MLPASIDTHFDDLEAEVMGSEEKEEVIVKSIPVDHFLVNLNFLAASKLVYSLFDELIKIDKAGEKEKTAKLLEEEKKDQGKNIHLKDGSGVSELQFVRMMKDINTKYSDGINEQQALQDVIDYIFYEKTE